MTTTFVKTSRNQQLKSDLFGTQMARPRIRRESITRISVDGFVSTWKKQLNLVEKTPLIEKLASFLRSAADVRIQIDKDEFEAPLLMLQCYSKFFQSKTGKKIIKLQASQINSETFQKITEWMQDPCKKVDRINLILMLKAARYLQIDILEQQILKLIADAQRFQESEALLLYLEASLFDCEDIKSLMIQRVQKFFLTFVSCEEFVELSVSEVENWLKRDNIGLNTEIEAFYVACRWLLHDWKGRKNLLMRLMNCVRFGLAEPWRIVELRMNRDHEKLNEILKNVELHEMLEKSLSYATYRCDFGDDSQQFCDFLQRLNYEKLQPRIVMKDAVFTEDFRDIRYSFSDFENYLKILRSNACSSWKTNIISCKEQNQDQLSEGKSQYDFDEILLNIENFH